MLTYVNGAGQSFKLTYISLMALSQKTVSLIVIAIVLSMTGLSLLQISLLGTARDMEEQSFQSSVYSALNSVSQSLETSEAARTALILAAEQGDSLAVKVMARHSGNLIGLDHDSIEVQASFFSGVAQPSAHWVSDTLIYVLPSPQRVRLGRMGQSGEFDSLVVDTFLEAGEHRIFLLDQAEFGAECVYQFLSDDSVEIMTQDITIFDAGFTPAQMEVEVEASDGFLSADSGRFNLVTQVISRLTRSERREVSERLEGVAVDSLVGEALNEAGVNLDFQWGVTSRYDDSLKLASDLAFASSLLESPYRVGLFTHDLAGPAADLSLYFPDRNIFLLRQIWPLALAAILFMAVVVLCFVYTFRTIVEQKRHAGLMVDFVNNMTHEFKTPISTIALAVEAIMRKDVISQEAKVARFSKMIASENQRMRNQTEKILQMAALEEAEQKLKLELVDIHDVLTSAVANISLRVEARQGLVECKLRAKNFNVMGDKVHLAGIVNNLLDNADKYSPEKPLIELRTANIGDNLALTIKDAGVGLKAEDRHRIFEKYYRVSSGDIHDVKGFGLGLSYVKLMVNAHGGEISVDSTFGHGTTFKISLPLLPSEKENQDASSSSLS